MEGEPQRFAPQRGSALTPEERRIKNMSEQLKTNLQKYADLNSASVQEWIRKIIGQPDNVFKHMPTMAGAIILYERIKNRPPTSILSYKIIRKNDVIENLKEISDVSELKIETDLLRYIESLYIEDQLALIQLRQEQQQLQQARQG